MSQRSSFDGKQNVFVFHTARFVDNPLIQRVILINNNVDDLDHLISGYTTNDENKDKVRQVYIHGKIADAQLCAGSLWFKKDEL